MVLYNVENISKKPKKDKKWKIWFGQKGPKIWPEGYGFLGKTSPNGSYQNILGWPKLFFDLLKSVPVLDFGPYRHAPKWPISPKMAIFKHVGNNQNVSQELISVHQTIKGDPNNGHHELEPNRSYLNHFPTWYAQYSHFYLFSCHFRLIKWANH